MRSIAIANQKGGVGKTTTSVNLAVALSRLEKQVCLIDLDPQAHATLHVGVSPGSSTYTAYDVLVNDQPLAAATVRAHENLWVVPSHLDLSVAEMSLAGRSGRESILRERLKNDPSCNGCSHIAGTTVGNKLRPQFDYVIIDCPPSLGLLSLNAMAAVDEVLLPLQPHFLALHGLSKLLETIELSAEHINPRLRLLGVAICLYEAGTRLAAEVGRDVESFFAEAGGHPSWKDARVFQTRIRRNIRLAEAPSFGQSIFEYAHDSNGASDYHNLASEVDAAVLPSRQDEPCEINKMAA
jgi:chromosome partitioning protein